MGAQVQGDGVKGGLTKCVLKGNAIANSKVIKMQNMDSSISKSRAQILRKEGLLINQGRIVLNS